jgi:hypothetical protein
VASIPYSTQHIDYLQRTGVTPALLPSSSTYASAPVEMRRLWRVAGVGRVDKSPVVEGQHKREFGLPQMDRSQPPVSAEQYAGLPSQDLLMGLYGHTIPLAFLIVGEPKGVAIHLGTWAETGERTTAASVVSALLRSLHPDIALENVEGRLSRPPKSGLVLGVPMSKPPDSNNGALPLDRLIRAMSGANWASLVLALPVPEPELNALRNSALKEMAQVSAAKEAPQPIPLAQHYFELLQVFQRTLTEGLAVGAWRTAVYLLGDSDSYPRLASLWRGIFSGPASLPEPVRVAENSAVADWAVGWALPEVIGAPGPGDYRRPYEFQTLLNSSQLAAYVHLPQLETCGFRVTTVPSFDTVPKSDTGGLQLGAVIDRGHTTTNDYSLDPNALTRHAFIAGVTGSGKTNTVFHLLKQMAKANVPFLVIEPAKTEYRALLTDPELGLCLRVYTVGDERIAPFRLNPFEVVGWPKTPVGVHIDLLRSVFTASFGMWTPLPQVLEQCLHGIYRDHGWDTATNTNPRSDGKSNIVSAFPTLSDLLAKVEEVTQQLGYDPEATSRVRAALRTRINSLRAGGKGLMLDGRRSIPTDDLLSHPTVLELEGMGDDDDKAFMIGLLFIRLVEYRRAMGQLETIRHVLVIEEAHRLLANVAPRGSEETADPRGKAVETFANLLSEIRAYGQGVIVADQIPVKLAPDVIKNTNLKIVHRIVAADDRSVLAGAMAMNERQAGSLATLTRGQAAVFAEEDDAPVLVQVPPAKGDKILGIPTEGQVSSAWKRAIAESGLSEAFLTYTTCRLYCQPPNPRCSYARQIAEQTALTDVFATFGLSLILSPDESRLAETSATLYVPVRRVLLQALLGPNVDPVQVRCAITHALYNFVSRRAVQYNWKYTEALNLTFLLLPALVAIAEGRSPNQDATRRLVEGCRQYRLACRFVGPFYGCQHICSGSCFFRYFIEPFVANPKMQEQFRKTEGNDYEAKADFLCQYVLDQVLSPAVGMVFRQQASLCFVTQQATAWRDYGLRGQSSLLDRMIAFYEKGGASS